MTEKRFEAIVDGFIDHKTGRRLTLWFEISRILNEFADENEQLKQQLIDVDKLIDDKIKEYKKYDGYDTEKYYIGTQLLKELKKELKGDVE